MSKQIEIVVTTPSGDQKVHSFSKTSVMIGSAAGNDLVIEDSNLTKFHARLQLNGSQLVIEDLGEGTVKLNGKEVDRARVNPSDTVMLGDASLNLRLATEGGEDVEVTEVDDDPELEGGDANAQFYWKSLKSFLAPIWHYVDNDGISEIMINGPQEIYIEEKGNLTRVKETFSNEKLDAAVLNIAQYVGRRVSHEEPYLDARLPDGSRVAVLLEPCSRKGTAISIRKFAKESLTIEKLMGFGSLSEDMALFIRTAVELKKNIVVSGGTSSGKTSLLNVLSSLIPNDERILTIEDSAELQLVQDHVLPMETKPPDKKGRGAVTIRDLVKVSLRMRPDRVIVGEIRGGEALDLLQAMNTGHSGSMATLHANNPVQALARLETLSLFSGVEIPMMALREQVSSAVDLVVQACRLSDKSRKVTHISEVGHLTESGSYQMNDIYKFVRTGTGEDGKIIGAHQWMGNKPSFMEEMEISGHTEAVALFNE